MTTRMRSASGGTAIAALAVRAGLGGCAVFPRSGRHSAAHRGLPGQLGADCLDAAAAQPTSEDSVQNRPSTPQPTTQSKADSPITYPSPQCSNFDVKLWTVTAVSTPPLVCVVWSGWCTRALSHCTLVLDNLFMYICAFISWESIICGHVAETPTCCQARGSQLITFLLSHVCGDQGISLGRQHAASFSESISHTHTMRYLPSAGSIDVWSVRA